MVSYAVITLFFAVLEASAKYADSRNQLCIKGLHRIIRRSQPPISKSTLLITLLSRKEATDGKRDWMSSAERAVSSCCMMSALNFSSR